MNLKCVKKEIFFDGINFRFREKNIGKAPEEIIMCCDEIPKDKMDLAKDQCIQNICGV